MILLRSSIGGSGAGAYVVDNQRKLHKWIKGNFTETKHRKSKEKKERKGKKDGRAGSVVVCMVESVGKYLLMYTACL